MHIFTVSATPRLLASPLGANKDGFVNEKRINQPIIRAAQLREPARNTRRRCTAERSFAGGPHHKSTRKASWPRRSQAVCNAVVVARVMASMFSCVGCVWVWAWCNKQTIHSWRKPPNIFGVRSRFATSKNEQTLPSRMTEKQSSND